MSLPLVTQALTTLLSTVFGGIIVLVAIVLRDKIDRERQEKQLLRQKLVIAAQDYNILTLEIKHERVANETSFDYTSISDKFKEPYKKLITESDALVNEARNLAKEFA